MRKIVYWLLTVMIVPVLVLTAGCGGAAVAAKKGDTVKVDYTGTLGDGTQFDSSIGREPLQFTVGAGQMIAGFDAAVVGMKVGEKKTVTIPAAKAYGERDESLVFQVDRAKLPANINPQVGMKLQMTQNDGSNIVVTITKVDESKVTMDANHELAGKDLTFEITMVEITSK
jgi:peptidylprolyl isomerase